MKHSNHKIEKKIQRQNAMDQGAYDGRFKHRIVPNKKKKKEKEESRKWRLDKDASFLSSIFYIIHLNNKVTNVGP